MCDHEHKYCPRCHEVFECKVGSILICQCTTVILNDAERSYIRSEFEDCLCVNCMRELRTAYHADLLTSKLKPLLRKT